MTVYIRNPRGEETVRRLPLLQVLKILVYNYTLPREQRAVVKPFILL